MCENAIPKASSSPVATTGRSLFSRLTSPLRSRTRNLADFHIRPLEPHRQYSPGDSVKGIVVLTVVKPIRITHLTVALHGFVSVYKNPNAVTENPGHDPALAPGAFQGRSQYFGNGHASLFQDEVILCGEGRLEVGVYEFEFDLQFPSRGLPSSIDFERGTISYMIRSTITRPTSIAATSSCDRKVNLIETVDIGPMRPPKPRTISLEPISKRSKSYRKSAKPKSKSESETVVSDDRADSARPRAGNSPVPAESASQRASRDLTGAPRTPLTSDEHSEASAESIVSNSTGLSFRLAPAPSSKSAPDSQGDRSSSSLSNKTITATIEMLKAGCLPGDSIPLRISIQHTKRIKSMHGIIITLYRQGRIDSAPPLSLFTDVKGKAAEKLKHEEYYPKSKTGLGGLSLSSAGSSSVFRKDLSQTFAPIIIDPVTLSTVVNSSIRVPEDAFPTITGVPGQMISFRYHIEVVIDLGGKLAGTSRHIPKLGMINVPSNFLSNGGQMLGREETSAGMLAAWGGSIVETDHIRREKSVVACLFEIIVGTTDSARVRRRLNTEKDQQEEVARPQTFTHNLPDEDVMEHGHGGGRQQEEDFSDDHALYYPEDPSQPGGGYEYNYAPAIGSTTHYEPHPTYHHNHVPPPEVPREEDLNEKERIRRAEQRLLPSAPPGEEGPSLSYTAVPTAPAESAVFETAWHDQAESVTLENIGPSQPPPIALATGSSNLPPTPASGHQDSQALVTNTEDKQELERRRLMAEASSPSDFPDDQENSGEGSSGAALEPSAPVLTEEDEYGDHYSTTTQPNLGVRGSENDESLPKYER